MEINATTAAVVTDVAGPETAPIPSPSKGTFSGYSASETSATMSLTTTSCANASCTTATSSSQDTGVQLSERVVRRKRNVLSDSSTISDSDDPTRLLPPQKKRLRRREQTLPVITFSAEESYQSCIINNLERWGWLTRENCEAVNAHPHPEELARLLQKMGSSGMFKKSICDAIIKSCSFVQPHFFQLLCSLHDHGLLDEEVCEILAARPHPYSLSDTMITLHKEKLLIPEVRHAIYTHRAPQELVLVIKALAKAELLTANNIEATSTYTHTYNLSLAIRGLSLAMNLSTFTNLLTQENLDLLLDPQHAFLTSDTATTIVWSRLRDNLTNHMTQSVFDNLVIFSKQADPTQQITDYMNQWLASIETR